ncbi:discoidin domain-containing protein [Nitrososphaera viennensis]|uniref:Discoidin domain-containing protein n=1 Tax=Nitrososphaera viennensis TaxID=1034015 RepID=A0A977IFC5_9ARCH|nr:discoidin domain-containing protein [Nitrososphaera viennensis]UVS69999.1 discoidin domain-containing protein [Nitrososphaera viennensis]
MRISATVNHPTKGPDKRSIRKRLVFLGFGAMLMLSLPAATGMVPYYASAAPACAALQVTKASASGNDGNVPNNTIDGKLGTRWSNLGKGSWISMDLGGTVNVCHVDVAWYRGDTRQNAFVISHSSDGKTYKQDYSAKSSGTTAGLQRYDFADVSARYIRITVNGNTENNWASITEIKVYGYVSGGGTQDTIRPFVAIDQPADNSEIVTPSSTTTTAAVSIKGKASDLGSGIKLVEVGTGSSAYQPATPASPGDWSTWTHARTLSVGNHVIVARATDNAGNQQVFTVSVKVSQKPANTPPPITPGPSPTPSKDRFGITKLNPTAAGGMEWSSSWDNGHARTIGNAIDPDDKWFDTAHGEGRYAIDGKGTLTASGDFVRMYVHDPAKTREWSENLEITLYIKRISETRTLSYSGLQLFARTNHGTNGNEESNICDDRGYGGLVNINGQWSFEKETAHHLDNGYDGAAGQRPSGNLPKDTWVGVKFVLRNMDDNTKVKLELYRDMTGGVNGGNWQKVTEFIDNGKNFGNGACKSGVNPALPLIHSFINASSETKKPMLTVYARHEHGTMAYSDFTIREINALP